MINITVSNVLWVGTDYQCVVWAYLYCLLSATNLYAHDFITAKYYLYQLASKYLKLTQQK